MKAVNLGSISVDSLSLIYGQTSDPQKTAEHSLGWEISSPVISVENKNIM